MTDFFDIAKDICISQAREIRRSIDAETVDQKPEFPCVVEGDLVGNYSQSNPKAVEISLLTRCSMCTKSLCLCGKGSVA